MSEDPHPQPRRVQIEISPRTLAAILIAIGAAWLAVRLWTVFVVLLIALVLVGTFDPLVGFLQRRGLKRGRALVLMFVVIALGLGVLVLITVPPLLAQLQHLVEDAPNERRHLLALLGQYEWANPFVKAIRAVPLDDLVVKAGNVLLTYSAELLSVLGYAVTTIFLALYLLAEPERAQTVAYALVPRTYHVKLARILIELKKIVGGYMRGQIITSVAIAVFTFLLMTVLRVQDALAIAVFAGLTDVIPFVGGYVASAPAIIAVAGHGAVEMVIVGALMFAYQEFESRVLVPRIYGRALRLSPALVLLALLTGGTLLGILGALLALPIAAGLQMIVRELRVELPGAEQLDEAVRARDEKAGAIYEQLTVGASVGKAAAIAGDIAKKMRASEEAGTPSGGFSALEDDAASPDDGKPIGGEPVTVELPPGKLDGDKPHSS